MHAIICGTQWMSRSSQARDPLLGQVGESSKMHLNPYLILAILSPGAGVLLISMPHRGQMLTGCFAQAERFACLYTSHVANLALYSPYKCYRGRMDSLAHEEEPVFGGGLPSSLEP